MSKIRTTTVFVLLIPIINTIALTTNSFIGYGFTSPGYIRALILSIFAILYFHKYFLNNKVNILIFANILYFFILSLLSSNITLSITIWWKFCLAILMLPVGYYYINNLKLYFKLIKILSVVLFLLVLSVILSNYFKLGFSDYLEDSIYFGSARVNITKIMVLILIFSPLIIRTSRNRLTLLINLLIIVTSFILVLIGVKRTAIFSLVIGFMIYYILTPYKSKILGFVLFIALFLAILSPLYLHVLNERFLTRYDQGRFNIEAVEDEGRTQEVIGVIEAFRSGSVFYKLFGAEIFNSTEFFNTTRILHTDYATVLSGSGLFGLFIFILIYYKIFKHYLRFYKQYREILIFKEISAINISLIVIMLFMGIAGTITSIDLRSLVFLLWGSGLSMLNSQKY